MEFRADYSVIREKLEKDSKDVYKRIGVDSLSLSISHTGKRLRSGLLEVLTRPRLSAKHTMEALHREGAVDTPDTNQDLNMMQYARYADIQAKSILYPLDSIPSREESKALAETANTPDEWQEVAKLWTLRLLKNKSYLQNHLYIFEDGKTLNMYYSFTGNLLSVRIVRGKEEVYRNEGKLTRVIGRMWGEQVATALAQGMGKPKNMDVKFTYSFMPEHYITMEGDESCESCMSHNSDFYGLVGALDGRDAHPLMAYENTPEAALMLLWDTDKDRAIARAIVRIQKDGVAFVSMYGNTGYHDALVAIPHVSSDDDRVMEGMKLHEIHTTVGVLAPFLDGYVERFELCSDGMLEVSCEGMSSNYMTGRLVEGGECTCCGETHTELTTTAEDGVVCEECLSKLYYYVEDRYGYYHGEVVRQVGDEYYHEDDVWYDDVEDVYYHDSVRFYELEVESAILSRGSYDLIVHKDNITKALDDYRVISIDGESIEEEDEENAA